MKKADLKIAKCYTRLRLGGTRADTGGLERALRATGAPLTVRDVPDSDTREVYGVDLLLLLPNMHVAWRGNRPLDDAAEIAAVVTGH